jgi:hypothetical protein
MIRVEAKEPLRAFEPLIAKLLQTPIFLPMHRRHGVLARGSSGNRVGF